MILPLLVAGCVAETPVEPVGQSSQASTVCASGTVVHGVDVSEFQGSVSWSSVKAAGNDFAIARISDGSYLDSDFAANWSGMKSAGLVRGAYQYFEPGESPSSQASIVVNAVGKLGAGDLPVTADMESTGGQSAATIAANLSTWVAAVKAGTGKTPMVYTAEGYWNGDVGSSSFSGDPLWVANWGVSCPNLPSGWGAWSFWQYSDSGSVSGISGAVDLDEYNGTLAQLQAFAGGADYAAQYVSQSWPLASTAMTMTTCQTVAASITLKNVGTKSWDSKTRLATTQPRDRVSVFADSTWVSTDRPAEVTGTVAPGDSFEFEFDFHAPATAGTYHEYFGLAEDGTAWFSDPGQGGPPDNDIEAYIEVAAGSTACSVDAGAKDAGRPASDSGTPKAGDSGAASSTGPCADLACWGQRHRRSTVDINGDGKADVCARGKAGISCWLSNGAGFPTAVTGPSLSDTSSWDQPQYDSTIQFADVNGDGKSDVCGRAAAGFMCWISDGTGFSGAISTTEFSDAKGWSAEKYYATIQMADVNGDGKADVCGRGADGFFCLLSDGAAFSTRVSLADMTDSGGWDVPEYYTTIQMADVNGDGKADVCGRGAAGFTCWLSTGAAFGATVSTTEMSDAAGWTAAKYYTTIQMADVNGDGKADVCGRDAAGLLCELSDGKAFSTKVSSTSFSDAAGWDVARYYGTVQLADVNSDGKADACGRAAAGFLCLLSKGTSFGKEISTDEFSDAKGWDAPEYYTTLETGDLDGDGKADVCGRGGAGVLCRLSSGTGFSAAVTGPPLSDTAGWSAAKYYETFALVGRRAEKPAHAHDAGAPHPGGTGDAGATRDAGAIIDAGLPRDAARGAPDGASTSWGDASGDGGEPDQTGGCSLASARTQEANDVAAWLLIGTVGLTARRRRPRGASPDCCAGRTPRRG